MFAKKAGFWMIVVVAAVGLSGCPPRKPRITTPGGPIIVIQPDPEPPPMPPPPANINYSADWIIDFAYEGVVGKASKTETLTGIPWRLGRDTGADKIQVTLITPHPDLPQNPTDASVVELPLDSSRVLKIELQASRQVPVWTLAGKRLTRRPLVYLPNWPHTLFGNVTTVTITDRNNAQKTVTVPITNLRKIEIVYCEGELDEACN